MGRLTFNQMLAGSTPVYPFMKALVRLIDVHLEWRPGHMLMNVAPSSNG